jgi:hypothetical protein
MEDEDSLEQTLRDENTFSAMPVITISNAVRIVERVYRERCVEKLLEILLYLENHLGAARIYIP